MFARTLAAAATAVAIAAGSLAGTATVAAAKDKFHQEFKHQDWKNQNWKDQDWKDEDWKHGEQKNKHGFFVVRFYFVPQSVCTPVYDKVVWYDNWGKPHWDKVQIGEKCKVTHVKQWKKTWVPYVKYPHHKLEFKYAY